MAARYPTCMHVAIITTFAFKNIYKWRFGDNRKPPPDEVHRLIEYCIRTRTPFVIGSDTNAHNEVTYANKRSEYIRGE